MEPSRSIPPSPGSTGVVAASHFDESILGYVHQDFTTLPEDATVEESLRRLRGESLSEKIIYFYVVDAERRLAGVVPTRRLLMADPSARIRDLMVPRVVALPESATVMDACEYFLLYKFLAFPVLRVDRTIAGVVDVGLFTEEMADVAERQAADDLFQLIGVHVARGRTRSAWESFRDRFPWLLTNIAGGLLCALLLQFYEPYLIAVLVLFIPIVLALAESVSIQSMTLVLQSTHEERVDWRMFRAAFAREAATAGLLGSACGATVGVLILAWKADIVVAGIVALCIALAVLTASLIGVVLPTAIRAFRGDPKIASGPIVLAAADLAALLFYFNIARWLIA